MGLPKQLTCTSTCCSGVTSGDKSSETHEPDSDGEATLLDDVNATIGAAELMIKLLELCPLSPRSLDDGPNQATEGNGTGQDCPAAASTQPQAVPQQAFWPTPKPTDWQDIERIAVKACMSLNWALSLTGLQHIPAETLHKLTALLVPPVTMPHGWPPARPGFGHAEAV